MTVEHTPGTVSTHDRMDRYGTVAALFAVSAVIAPFVTLFSILIFTRVDARDSGDWLIFAAILVFVFSDVISGCLERTRLFQSRLISAFGPARREALAYAAVLAPTAGLFFIEAGASPAAALSQWAAGATISLVTVLILREAHARVSRRGTAED